MAWKNEEVDYTGARAHDYIDSYTNRPEDAGSLEGLQDLLSNIGMAPGVGEPADLLNALLYAGQGKGKEAGLSALSMMPFLGSMKLFRGIPEWYRGSVKKGKFIGGDIAGRQGIFATPNKKYAEEYMQTNVPGSRLMEFDVPDKFAKKMHKDDYDAAFDFIEGGIPKEYLEKVY